MSYQRNNEIIGGYSDGKFGLSDWGKDRQWIK